MDFQYFAYYTLSIIAIIVNAVLAFQIWQRRPGKGVLTFLVLFIAITVWISANTLELYVTTLQEKILYSQLAYLGIVLVAPLWLVFTLEYTNRGQWLTRRNIALLTIEPIIILCFIFTNSSHGLYWTEIILDTSSGYSIAQYERGVLFLWHTIYSYILLIISTILLFRTFWRVRGLYRQQIVLLLIAQFTPWLGNLLYLLDQSVIPAHMDSTPIGFSVTAIVAGWTLLRFKLMDAMPIARDVVFDNIDDAVFVLNLKQQIVDVNQAGADLIGKTSTEIIGEYASNVFDNQSEVFKLYAFTERVDTEIKVDGEDRTNWYRLKITPLQDDTGESLGRVAMLQDITQSKTMEQHIKEARDEAIKARLVAEEHSRLKSEFLANMSHELRTPLNAINGFTSILLSGMGVELSEKAHRMIERVGANSQILIGLVEEILDISRIEAGSFELIPETIITSELIHRWEDSIGVLAANKGLDFYITLSSDFPESIVTDSSSLDKIILNLLSNAVKFTHEGHVRLNLEVKDDKWLFKINDTGIGIAEDAQELIFEEFRQVDGSSTREYGGIGLGLALAQKLTIAMGGQIQLESELGQGSTFIVTLPRFEEKKQNSTSSGEAYE